MNLIKVTSLSDKKPIYINVDMIGHFYRVPEKKYNGRIEKVEYTKIGVTTHNNGGFEITETPEMLIKYIERESLKRTK
jgi:hypothetical protein